MRVLIVGFSTLGALCLHLLLHEVMGAYSPYTPFVAAVLISAALAGWEAGVASAVLSGIAASVTPADGGWDWSWRISVAEAWALGTFWVVCAAVILVAYSMGSALSRERALARQLDLVSHELEHRIKNVLGLAQAMVRQTARDANSVAGFRDKLIDRLSALARAQDLLLRAEGGAVPLADLIDEILGPHKLNERVVSGGGSDRQVTVPATLTPRLSLILHELATNAVKYGALSNEAGELQLDWRLDSEAIVLDWKESHGPAVTAPGAGGFGTRLFRRVLNGAGYVNVSFAPNGVEAEIRLLHQRPGER